MCEDVAKQPKNNPGDDTGRAREQADGWCGACHAEGDLNPISNIPSLSGGAEKLFAAGSKQGPLLTSRGQEG